MSTLRDFERSSLVESGDTAGRFQQDFGEFSHSTTVKERDGRAARLARATLCQSDALCSNWRWIQQIDRLPGLRPCC